MHRWLLGGRLTVGRIEPLRWHLPHSGRIEGQEGAPIKRSLPSTPEGWLDEIRLAIKDARATKPFGILVGQRITDTNLFHLAPLVCLKFRGRKLTGEEADRVIKTALANYVVNSDPEGVDHGLSHKPLLAFALCYVASHLVLALIDEEKAEAILNFCEEHLEG